MAKNNDKNIATLCERMSFTSREAYKMLRTNVLFTLADNDKCKKIGVTSPVHGEGKSTVAINLAYTLAVSNSKVLLIDMDMRLPSIAKKLGVERYKVGLSDYLINGVSQNDLIHNIGSFKNFSIITAGAIPPNPSELISSEKLKKFITSLEEYYDFIIFDLPPVNVVTDALAAKELMDGQLVVVREGYSDKFALSDCMRQLDFVEMNVLGFVYVNAGSNDTYYGKHYYSYKYKNQYYYKKKNNDWFPYSHLT